VLFARFEVREQVWILPAKRKNTLHKNTFGEIGHDDWQRAMHSPKVIAHFSRTTGLNTLKKRRVSNITGRKPLYVSYLNGPRPPSKNELTPQTSPERARESRLARMLTASFRLQQRIDHICLRIVVPSYQAPSSSLTVSELSVSLPLLMNGLQVNRLFCNFFPTGKFKGPLTCLCAR
jgi:hypothetical protein